MLRKTENNFPPPPLNTARDNGTNSGTTTANIHTAKTDEKEEGEISSTIKQSTLHIGSNEHMDAKTASYDWRSSSTSTNLTGVSNSNDRDGNSSTSNAPLHKNLHSASNTGQFSSAANFVPRRRERWEANTGMSLDSRTSRKRDREIDRDRHFRDRERDRDGGSLTDRGMLDRESWSRDRDRNRSSSTSLDWSGRNRDREFTSSDKFRDRGRERNPMPPRNSKHFFRASSYKSDRDRDFRDNSKIRDRYADRERKWIPKRELSRDRVLKPSTSVSETISSTGHTKEKYHHSAHLSTSTVKSEGAGNGLSERERDYYGPSDSFVGKRNSFKNIGAIESSISHIDRDKETRSRDTERGWEKPRDPRTRDNDRDWENRDRDWDRDRDRDRDRSVSAGFNRGRDSQTIPFSRRSRPYSTHTRSLDEETKNTDENDSERKYAQPYSSRSSYHHSIAKRKDEQSLDDTGTSSIGFFRRRNMHKPPHFQSGYFKSSWSKRSRPSLNDSHKTDSYERTYPKPKFQPLQPSFNSNNSYSSQRPRIEQNKTITTESTYKPPTDPRSAQFLQSNHPVQVQDSTQKEIAPTQPTRSPPRDPRHLNDPRRLQNQVNFVASPMDNESVAQAVIESEKKASSELTNAPNLQETPSTQRDESKEPKLSQSSINTAITESLPKRVLKRPANDTIQETNDPRKKTRTHDAPSSSEENAILLTCASLGPSDKVAKAERAVKRLSELNSLNDSNFNDSSALHGTENNVALPTKSKIFEGITGLDSQIKEMQSQISKLKEEIKMTSKNEHDEEKLRRETEEIEKRKTEDKELSKKRQQEIEKVQSDINCLRDLIQENQNDEEFFSTKHKGKTKNANHDKQEIEVLEKTEKNVDEQKKLLLDEQIEKSQVEVSESMRVVEGMLKCVQCDQNQVLEDKNALKGVNLNIELSYLHGVPGFPRLQEPNQLRTLVQSVFMENHYLAMEAQLDSLSSIPEELETEVTLDDENNCNHKEWNNFIRRITSQANALYIDAQNNPFYHEHNERHKKVKKHVASHVQSIRKKVWKRWEELGHEYFIRQKKFIRESGEGTFSSSLSSSHLNGCSFSIMGGLTGNDSSESSLYNHARVNTNPYRRARRGNGGLTVSHQGGDVVRSEYEQEQIIAELTAKEAMEKRIATGSCSLPRQRCTLEMELYASFQDDQTNRRVLDPVSEEEERKNENPWTDVEKCIFLDRFLQDPKNFRKIASSLRNKSTKDCIDFYYSSKKTVPYKEALKEYQLRKKRKGDASWDATIQAAISMGAFITEGPSRDKPIIFSLTKDDNTFHTNDFHPMKRSLFDSLAENTESTNGVPHSSKPTDNIDTFLLDDLEFLRTASTYQSQGGSKKKNQEEDNIITEANEGSEEPEATKLNHNDSKSMNGEGPSNIAQSSNNNGNGRKPPQKWSTTEKNLFFETVNEHGRDWEKLVSVIKTKSMTQIKNYFYDHKKQFSKLQPKSSLKENDQDEAQNDGSDNPAAPLVTDGDDTKEKPANSQTLQESDKDLSDSKNGSNAAVHQSKVDNFQQREINENQTKRAESWDDRNLSSSYVSNLHRDHSLENKNMVIPHNGVVQGNGSYPFVSNTSTNTAWLPNSSLSYGHEQVARFVDRADNSMWLNTPGNRGPNAVIPISSVQPNYENMFVQIGHPHVNIEAERREQHIRHPYLIPYRNALNQATNGDRNYPEITLKNPQNASSGLNRPWGHNPSSGPRNNNM